MIGGGGGGFAEEPLKAGPRTIAQGIETGIGKGIRDTCAPYAEFVIFGAELNPEEPTFGCPPELIDPTDVYDLSTLTPDHEVVLALYREHNVAGGFTLHFDWFRARDDALLFHFAYDVPVGPWASYYAYSYLGYVPWEIYENGDYYVLINLIGRLQTNVPFSVIGIPAPSGQASNLEIAYERLAPASAGAWLDPNDFVIPQVWHTYLGPTVGVVEALAPIADYFIALHHYDWDTETWTQYDGPAGAFDSLTTVQNGQAYLVQVSERCFWSW